MQGIESLSGVIEYLHEREIPYEVAIGSSSAVLKVNGKTQLFTKDKTNRAKALAMTKRLKKDIDPVLHEFEEFNIQPSDVDYYEINENVHHSKEAVNIDISSAYPSVLAMTGAINKANERRLFDLPKKDRLVSMGTLAYEPLCINFDGERITDYYVRKNIYRPVFFYCVKIISDLMHEIKEKILKEDFIFYWVDGIYFNNNPKKEAQIKDFLNKKGFKYSRDHLTDLKSEFKGDGYQFNYKKENKEKTVFIPAFSSAQSTRKKIAISNYTLEPTKKNFEKLVEKFYI